MNPTEKFTADDLLIGWKAIAKYVGKSRWTVDAWSKKYGLPILRTPSGNPMLSKTMYLEYLKEGNKPTK